MQQLKTVSQWKDVLHESVSRPVLVLKHSSTCPVSAAGYEAFRSYETDVPKYIAVVQTAREVSNQIAEDTGIRHESPQALLLKDGKAVWHASHYGIQREDLAAAERQNEE